MSDYTMVLKGLRHCINLDGLEPNDTRIRCSGCPYFTEPTRCGGILMRDAAVAIEALQADVDKANKSADAYRAMYFAKRGDITIEKVKELDEIDFHFHSALIRLMYKRIEELEAKSPKRGKWIHGKELSRAYVGNCCVGIVYEDFRCSACGVTIKECEKPKWKYCPNCGAKMEVQE